MAVAYLKLQANFTLIDYEDEKSIKEQLNGNDINTMAVSIINDDKNCVGFYLDFDKNFKGDATFDLNDEGMIVKIDGIFKVNVKPNYLDNFLEPNLKWKYDRFIANDDLVADVSNGLEVETYSFKSMGNEYTGTRYLLNPTTALKKSDL